MVDIVAAWENLCSWRGFQVVSGDIIYRGPEPLVANLTDLDQMRQTRMATFFLTRFFDGFPQVGQTMMT